MPNVGPSDYGMLTKNRWSKNVVQSCTNSSRDRIFKEKSRLSFPLLKTLAGCSSDLISLVASKVQKLHKLFLEPPLLIQNNTKMNSILMLTLSPKIQTTQACKTSHNKMMIKKSSTVKWLYKTSSMIYQTYLELLTDMKAPRDYRITRDWITQSPNKINQAVLIAQ